MGAADIMLLALLALADLGLMFQLRRRRQRRLHSERVMRSLRLAVQREVGSPIVRAPRFLAWQRAS